MLESLLGVLLVFFLFVIVALFIIAGNIRSLIRAYQDTSYDLKNLLKEMRRK